MKRKRTYTSFSPRYTRRVVRRLQKRLLLTASEFAQLMNVSKVTVYSWRSGAYAPQMKRMRELDRLEKMLGLPRLALKG